MKRWPSYIPGAVLLFAVLPGIAGAASRFPPPDFESGHQLPTATTPAPDASWYAILDVAVLIAALGVASYLILARRSRRGVIGVTIFAIIYFGFWREGCVCPIGSVQNVSLALFDRGYVLPLIVGAFFLIPIIFTFLFGRTFCAAVCPLGAIQDLVATSPVRVPMWLETPLSLLRHIYLAAAVLFAATGSAFIICEYDPFIAIFRLSGRFNMVLLGVAMLLLGMIVVRPYCRYFCPYGVILGWISRASTWHARIDPQQCVNCHLCKDTCPVNAIRVPTVEPIPPAERGADRRRFVLTAAALPLIVALGAGIGYLLVEPMSRMDVAVRLADRLHAEQAGVFTDLTDQTKAFRATGSPIADAYDRAATVTWRYRIGTPIAGAFVALAFGMTWLQLARRTRRAEYDIDRAWCVACARCFRYCPHDPRNVEMLNELTAAGQMPAAAPGTS
ncbi:MAG: 4Fe-4S ferredoxin [Planctomycetaceae bacterium]|nr:4Fe-4S ferredoxin [Planctomycetaceae bacterium]